MASSTLPAPDRLFRGDAALVGWALVQGGLFLMIPSTPLLALGIWWNSNTISHNFIHRPFFRSRAANIGFALYLTVLLGIPQSLWRNRHLAHHANIPPRLTVSTRLVSEIVLILAIWTVLIIRAPEFFATVYLPGYFAGLALCALHGHFEHSRGTISHYGSLYNFLCFNDGYHREHHAFPARHWARLPELRAEQGAVSKWPAPLRWMEIFSLDSLESLVLESSLLQRWVLRAHSKALAKLIATLPPVHRATIVGGGLFPRTALILERLLPGCHITIIDANRSHLDRARKLLGDRGIELRLAHFPESPAPPCGLLVIPLAFDGNREALYARPPAPAILIHDWIWRRRGCSRIVSLVLAKRLNLMRLCEPPAC